MEWIPVEQELPPFHEKVLFCGVGPREPGHMEKVHAVLWGCRMPHPVVRGGSWEWMCDRWRYNPEQVTHWMKLPDFPKE